MGEDDRIQCGLGLLLLSSCVLVQDRLFGSVMRVYLCTRVAIYSLYCANLAPIYSLYCANLPLFYRCLVSSPFRVHSNYCFLPLPSVWAVALGPSCHLH